MSVGRDHLHYPAAAGFASDARLRCYNLPPKGRVLRRHSGPKDAIPWGVSMRRLLPLALLFVFLLLPVLAGQETNPEKKTLKNADIVLMTQNHFDDETLLKVIEVSETDFDVSGDALISMKNQGVSPVVLRAMLQASQKKRGAAVPVSAAAASNAPTEAAPAPPAAAPGSAPMDATSTPNAPAASNAGITPAQPAAAAPLAAMQGRSPGMMGNPQELAAMQSQMQAMGLGGMLGGMFGGMSSMNYSAEQVPHVFLMGEQHMPKQEVAPSMAQIAQTKFKSGAPGPGGTILRTLATQGLSFAAMAAGPGGMMAMSAFSMASGFMPGMRSGAPSMTYVWGLPGRKSSRELVNSTPTFQLNYGDIPGVDPDAYEPVIVKLVQTKDNYRLVGATRSKMNRMDMMSGSGPENGKWLAEDRWPATLYKEERGFYVLRVDQPFEPGEYAVVLRPTKGYKATPSGLGGHAQVFYSVWDFSVPGTPPADSGKKKKK